MCLFEATAVAQRLRKVFLRVVVVLFFLVRCFGVQCSEECWHGNGRGLQCVNAFTETVNVLRDRK